MDSISLIKKESKRDGIPMGQWMMMEPTSGSLKSSGCHFIAAFKRRILTSLVPSCGPDLASLSFPVFDLILKMRSHQTQEMKGKISWAHRSFDYPRAHWITFLLSLLFDQLLQQLWEDQKEENAKENCNSVPVDEGTLSFLLISFINLFN